MTHNSNAYLGVEICDIWPMAKLMPGAVITDCDRAERYEAFIGDERPSRSLAAGSQAEIRRLIREALGEA
jgi:hypothetical protein